jgi:hypothetical protein
MDSWIAYLICFFLGAVCAIVALAIVKSGSKDIVEIDPEKEEAAKQWKEQSKGY